jgi:hypothetical protein
LGKKAAINTSPPNLIQAVLEGSGKNVATTHIDFHAIAKNGLGRKRKRPDIPEPTVCFE